ncbi:LOW QUALITY PROTEIN: HECT, UBA and WWE domain containing E3 ubiquitin protein ligase 1 [Tachypleus tridentatus]|uniref:LOW QUALITY PROTEIN: HECT, UBA and WWE domain containing E3 ubiquitin protein ligase 1 n=1 Tax=Tachypleus tridentatus TaxID=6853 RepID=UPI003FD03B93
MKIDRSKLKKSSSEVPADCRILIEKLKGCNDDELVCDLKKIKTWNCGKCELYHWTDVLDKFDTILEAACQKIKEGQWCLPCDMPGQEKNKALLLQILQFTALLIEHSFSRHLYNSVEHLTTLLSSSDMQVVLGVLNLLYVFSKRSNFITRLNAERRQALLIRLTYLAENWGGKENGFGLAECCQDLPLLSYPPSATTLHFEFYTEVSEDRIGKKHQPNNVCFIHIDRVDQILGKNPSQIMEDLINTYAVSQKKQMLLFTHVRLAHSFSDYTKRLQCVQARLQALSILVYCNAIQENVTSLLYNGLIEELVDVLELKTQSLIEIKAASLRTLTSIIHLDRTPKLNSIIDATGASSYHGFLPVLVRSCIQSLTDPELEPFPLPFATALFSFLYHLASYESGGEALVACGMMEALLKVINWHGTESEHITFVTRAVRVIDLITNLDMQAFHSHGGLISFINRLEMEIGTCKEEQPYIIKPRQREPSVSAVDLSSTQEPSSLSQVEGQLAMEIDSTHMESGPRSETAQAPDISHNIGSMEVNIGASVSDTPSLIEEEKVEELEPRRGVQCFPQRAALLKSMLNFLKKAIQDPSFSDSIRHLMDGSLPKSLKHIISNAEYYGPSLFLLATDVVTVYVFQEPSLLSSLQDSGLTDVVLHALLVKEVPATREVLASLPNVFSALCLNTRGLQAFVACKPFERLFKVLLSPDYLPAMKRRRSSDPMGDTASNLGNAMDELMRHQPSLRADATAAIIKLLEELCAMGRDPRYVCSRPAIKNETATTSGFRTSTVSTEAGSSDEEDDDDEETGGHTVTGTLKSGAEKQVTPEISTGSETKIPIPLVDYILNVMRFVDAILSNNSTDDHCREFVRQKGLVPLMGILGLSNLPVDFPVTPACQAVASVCKSILNLAHEPQVLKQGLLHLNEVLQSLEPLHCPLEPPGGSILLEELITAPNLNEATANHQSTPLLHAMAAAHAYIIMFVHVCRTGQSDIRTISISHWGSELGLSVLRGLSRLYTSLVWESTVLLALCSENTLPANCQFGRHQLDRLLPRDLSKLDKQEEGRSGLLSAAEEFGSNGVTSAMEALSTNGGTSAMEVDESSTVVDGINNSEIKQKGKISPLLQAQIKQIKPLLSGASRLGRALAELFGLLVKLCVGSPMRQRRGQQIPPSPTIPTPAARAVASALTHLLASGLSWEPPETSPLPKFRLTFYICSVGFTSPMLFDERKYPYHLMLQKFLSSGGQDAFFETFRWALTCGNKVPMEDGLEHPDLPDGTGEFLDAWLMLLEKMVNPKMVMESPHTLPVKSSQPGFVPFNPVLYLVHTHKLAFQAIMHLWNRKPLKLYGDRMAESILAILCHLLRGESIIKEKLSKEKEGETANNSNNSSTNMRSRRGQELEEQGQLQQLMDMGFSRQMALEALLTTNSLEQATDYLLSHPAPLPRWPQSGAEFQAEEEDQMLRAIAMSLGENVLVSTNQVEEEPRKVDDQQELEREEQQDEEPLSSKIIDDFTDRMLPGCLRLLDTLPDTVYRVCDLLVAVVNRNGESWRDRMLEQLIQEIEDNVSKLLSATAPMTTADTKSVQEWVTQLSTLPEAGKTAVRIHLFTLLFEEMRISCACLVEKHQLIDTLVTLLDAAQQCFVLVKEVPTPKWPASVCLLIDLFERASISSIRRAPLLKVSKRQWKWFDDRTGRWNSYTGSNNKTIDDAYKVGEQSIRFTAGRRRYTVQFSTMVQINEETGNWRPIMLTLEDKEKEDNRIKEKTMDTDDSGTTSEIAIASPVSQPIAEVKIVQGLTREQSATLVRACIGLISIPVEPDSLHAVMRLCLRLTRSYENAVIFTELGGPKLLLNLTQSSAFTGFTSLATLLIRHVLEDPQSLRSAMEKVVRHSTQSSNSPLSNREMHYVLRVLGPAACRDPELFKDVAKSTLRIALLPLTKREEDDRRYTSTNAVQMLKALPAKGVAQQVTDGPMKDVICELLNALVVKPEEGAGNQTETSTEQTSQRSEPQGLVRDNSANDLLQQDDDEAGLAALDTIDTSDSNTTGKDNKQAKDQKAEELAKKTRPLLPKSAICRLLAELIRSYGGCAKLVVEHAYSAAQTELILESCTALAFILDNLLPQCQTAGDKDTPALARVLIAALASCNHTPEAQTALVNEVKAALHRALALTESADKHARIQALTGLIGTMIESCPSSSSSQSQMNSSTFRQQQNSMNNMVRILLKRGLVTDLARIPHSLDLSSPHMATTVNSALKPLETLSRIVNLPTNSQSGKGSNRTKTSAAVSGMQEDLAAEAMEEDTGITQNEEGSAVRNTETSTSEATNAYGEVTVDDSADNTDSEAPDVGATLEEAPVTASFSQEIINDNEAELEGIIDELLDHDNNGSEDQILGEVIYCSATTALPENAEAQESQSEDIVISMEAEIEDHHDSQMISHHESEFEDHTQEDRRESSDSDTNSESGHSHSEEDEGEHDDDDEVEHEDGDEEAEDDDEDDDEGSHFDAEEDDYQDIEEALFHIEDRDDSLFFQLEEVFPSSGSIVFGGTDGIRTFQLPMVSDDTTSGAETSAPSIPPAPGNVSTRHPLLIRHGDPHSAISSRVHRAGRQRASYRAALGNHTWHMYAGGSRHPNPPAILQRLLGPSTAQDILQLTSSFNSHPASGQTRVIFANSDLRILATDEDLFEIQEQNSLLSGGGSGTLASIPSALVRWTEESRVLDGDSGHDCVTGIKSEIIDVLEKHRDEELALRKEKRKKMQEEDEGKDKDKEKTRQETSVSNNLPISTVGDSSCESEVQGSTESGGLAMEVLPSDNTRQNETNLGLTEASGVSSLEAPTTVESDSTRQLAGRLIDAILEQLVTPVGEVSSTVSSVSSGVSVTAVSNTDYGTSGEGPAASASISSSEHSVLQPFTCSLSSLSSARGWRENEASQQLQVDTTAAAATTVRQPQQQEQSTLLPGPLISFTSPMDTSEPPSHIPSVEIPTVFSQRPVSIPNIQSSRTDTSLADSSVWQVAESTVDLVMPTSESTASSAVDIIGILSTSDDTSTPEDLSHTTSAIISSAETIHTSTNTITQVPGSSYDTHQLITSEATSTTISATEAGTSSSTSASDYVGILGDTEIPEGVDPSFLAALPENIRQEVIAEQLRLQRLRQRAQAAATSQTTSEGTSFTEVNPEFLAALPPNIQEEVLAQQRAEQQRLAAQNSNPDTPVDPANFIQTLPPGLRQQVLADMDDSLLALLPSDLATEAHTLRREWETRHRQMQERLFSSHAGTALSRILRSAGRMGTRYTIHTVPHRGQWAWNTLSSRAGGACSSGTAGLASTLRLRGKQLLDHEALSCLLVLLFMDEPKLNTTRLHRVLRNLCYHPPTRQWMIKSLLSILERTKDFREAESTPGIVEMYHRGKKSSSKIHVDTSSPQLHRSDLRSSQPTWLSVSLDAALGCRTSVFQVHKHSTKRPSEKHQTSTPVASGFSTTVTIHPQASPVVCRHVLDTLIALAKSFPVHFLPEKAKEEKISKETNQNQEINNKNQSKSGVSCPRSESKSFLSSTTARLEPASVRPETDFWEVLVKLDSLNTSRKGKNVMRIHSGNSNSQATSLSEEEAKYQNLETSAVAQLISMLCHPVVKRSSLLTDKLLRLLALISLALPDQETQTYQNQLTAPASTPRQQSSGLLARAIEAPSCGRDERPNSTEESFSSEGVTEKKFKPAVQVSKEEEVKEPIVLEQHLKLAVEVLTSKACSEEGLEDATALLLRLSRGCPKTRQAVLRLLLVGTRELGNVVCSHISSLMTELRSLNAKLAAEKAISGEAEDRDREDVDTKVSKGMIHDRFTNTAVVITAPGKVKGGGRELQLPSMAALTSKTSSQAFFLRILKVIIQLREAARITHRRNMKGISLSSDIVVYPAATVSQGLAESQPFPPLVTSTALGTTEGSTSVVTSAPGEMAHTERMTVTSAPSLAISDILETETEAHQSSVTPMELDSSSGPKASLGRKEDEEEELTLPRLSEELHLDDLWEMLSECLKELADTPDHHAVLVLQPAVEAFFLVHASSTEKDTQPSRREYRLESRENQLAHIHQEIAPLSPLPAGSEPQTAAAATVTELTNIFTPVIFPIYPNLPSDTQKFLKFAETHRTVLNQILRQSTTPLADGPFAVLVDHTRVLDFDVKRRYFRQELERMDDGARREDLAVHVRREHVFEDSFRELHRRTPEEWKNRFYIVFEGEEGQDAGGLLREWYTIISREIFNPMYALFTTSPGDRVTYMINPSSHCNSNHLSYFKFVGRVIAKAVYDNKLLECYFTRSFYKHILGKLVKYTDMESEDYSFYQGLVFLLDHAVNELGYELTFSVEVQEFGVTEIRDLKPNGRNIPVTEENKHEYVRLVCQEKMTGAIRRQLNAFLEGFYEIIPKRLISIFNEQELELLISGLPNIDIDDLKSNTEYHKYQHNSLQIQWFWRALRSFDQADRAKFLQFVTGTSKVPLQGFSALEGMNGTQKFQIHRDDRSTDRLPSAHTCFNQLDLPAYETFDKLRSMLLKAVQECSEGFGFA